MSRSPRRRQPAVIARPSGTADPQAARRARLTAMLLAGVLALKVALALALAGHPLLQPEGELDAGEYWRLAQRVVGGDVLLQGTPFYVSPLYIYWLAAAVAITGGSVAGVLALQAIVGTLATWLAARTAAAWAPAGASTPLPVPALVAGGTLALTGVVALQEALILQSSLDPFLVALVAFVFTKAVQAPSTRRWLACGAALALFATNRPNAWLLALLCLPAAMAMPGPGTPRWRAVGAWALGAVLVLVPFTARTAVATGAWQVLPGHGGLNFYVGNHPGANGTYTIVDGIRPSIEGQREDARRVASRARGRDVSDAEASSYFAGQAIAWWTGSPLSASRLLAYKAWLATHPWELPVNVSYAWFREQVWLVKLLPVGAWLLVPVGLAVSVGGHLAVAGEHQRAWRWFRWLLPAYLLGVAVFFVVDRYRAPALVLGAIHLGVLGGMRDRPEVRDRRSTLSAIAVALVLVIAGLVPLPFQLGQAEADTRMALHAIEDRRDRDAEAWLERAVTRDAAPGVAWFRAGLAWQARGDLAQAESALRRAHDLDPDVGDVSFALAGVLLTQGRGADAVPLLEHAERTGVRPDRVGLDLALALWQAGDERRARDVLSRGVPEAGLPLLRARALASVEARRTDLAEWLLGEHHRLVPADAEVAEKLGLMKARRGDTAGAAALFEEAARLDPARATARFNLAIARLQMGRRDEAIALLRDALRIDPTYEQAAGALRELLAER